jgi:hypothetical protein
MIDDGGRKAKSVARSAQVGKNAVFPFHTLQNIRWPPIMWNDSSSPSFHGRPALLSFPGRPLLLPPPSCRFNEEARKAGMIPEFLASSLKNIRPSRQYFT